MKNWFIGKGPDAGKDWRQEEKGATEDKMIGWHRWLDGYQFEQAPGVGDGQESLECCSPWGHKDSDTTEQLNWTDVYVRSHLLCCWIRVFAMTTAFFWQNSVSLCLLHFVLQGQTCLLLQVSLDFLILHSSPLWWKGHLFLVLVLEGLVGHHRTVQLLQH